MRNPGINKVMAGLAMLIVAIAIVLRVSDHIAEKAAARPAAAERGVRPTQSSSSRHVRPEGAVTSGVDTQEVAAVGFDWRQTLTNQATPPTLPREEVEKYLEHNQRNAASLLAAYRALRDAEYLKEAASQFPNDARVQLSILAADLFPEERRKWLDLFKASSPDNSLANYLSAREYLKNGQSGPGTRELFEAAGKPGFQNYAIESKLDEEELNMAAGRSTIQARLSSSGWAEDLLPQLASLKGLAQETAGLEKQFLSAGDAASAQTLAQTGLALARRLDPGDGAEFVISQLVGRAIEGIVLSPLDPNTSYDFLGGKTPTDRMAEVKEQKASLTALRQNFRDTLPNMTEAELLSYTERQRLYGEMEAMRWLQQRGNASRSPQPGS